MKNHTVTEYDVTQGNDIYKKLQDPDVAVGDTITYIPNNQEGMASYRVIMTDGKKSLEQIYYDDEMMGKKSMSKKRKSMSKKRKSMSKKRKSMSKKCKTHNKRITSM